MPSYICYNVLTDFLLQHNSVEDISDDMQPRFYLIGTETSVIDDDQPDNSQVP